MSTTETEASPVKKAIDALVSLLEHEDPFVRIAAAREIVDAIQEKGVVL